MSTAKHYSFCSGPMRGKSVTALPGIGETYGGRLSCAGYSMASDIYDKFKDFGFQSSKCQNWLSLICGANSRYSSMCYEAIKEWHEQFGDTETYSKSPTPELPYMSPMRFSRTPSLDNYTLSRDEITYQQSPPISKNPDISRAEVLQMIGEFQKKQDAMTTRINALEQENSRTAAKIDSLEKEKTKTNNYVKTLEARVKHMDRMATVLQKQQNTSVEQYKNISSSVYLYSQKLEEALDKMSGLNQDSKIVSYIKILEVRIEIIEENVRKHQKELDEKILELTKKISDMHTYAEIYKNKPSSTDLSRKLLTKKQSKLKHEKSFIEESLETRIKQMEDDLGNITIEIRKLTENRNKETKKEFNNKKNNINSTQISQDVLSSEELSKTIIKSYTDVPKDPSFILDDDVVKQVNSLHAKQAIPNFK